MSTVSTSKPPIPPAPKPDPYRYGWRYVRIEEADGSVSFDQVPLTLEDVLFPEVGDFIVQTDAHIDDWTYLRVVFKAWLAGDPTAVVVTDCRVDWNIPGVRPLGPDVAVFFDVKQHRDWATLDVAAEGARPVLVVEITSPDTRQNDLVVKVDYYYRAGVPLYVIADAKDEHDGGRRLELIAYRHTPAGYERIAADARGWIWLEPVRLWLGIRPDRRLGYDRLACFDPDTLEEIGDYTAVSQALEIEAEAREQAEAQARVATQAKAQAEVQARIATQAKAQAEAEARVATQAKAQAEAQARIATQAKAQAETRAAQAQSKAQAEAEARAQAEARIRELEAELNRLTGQGSSGA
ncbi:MAG: Uma2 family endonuclease [Isosphaeraceae bacterium]